MSNAQKLCGFSVINCAEGGLTWWELKHYICSSLHCRKTLGSLIVSFVGTSPTVVQLMFDHRHGFPHSTSNLIFPVLKHWFLRRHLLLVAVSKRTQSVKIGETYVLKAGQGVYSNSTLNFAFPKWNVNNWVSTQFDSAYLECYLGSVQLI